MIMMRMMMMIMMMIMMMMMKIMVQNCAWCFKLQSWWSADLAIKHVIG